ncbi:MAG: peptidylprolyl isomerase [Bacilli bacterium]|jgi:parvulin-like peptidyl-prolyl isomerase|nr:peptidylprolyl isomerase [Bacilli bacterium]
MKHKKLSIALVSAFIAALGLTACSDVTAKDNSILTLTGYNGETLDVDATALFNEYKTSANGISKFYEAILEVLIRNYFDTSTDADVKAKLVSLKAEAEDKVKAKEQEARSNANTNGTKYDEEWEKILDNNKVEDRKELVELFLYQLEKKEIEDKHLDNNLPSLTSEYIGFKKEGGNWAKYSTENHKAMSPYHIRHILVKTSGDASNYVTSEITADEAQHLNTVYEALASATNTFGNAASQWSDDTSSSIYGDAGIMDVSTSFVNEFKLGIFAFDGIYAKNVTGDQTFDRKEFFGLDKEYDTDSGSALNVDSQLEQIGLGEVSFEVFKRLGEVYKTEKTPGKVTVNEGVAKYFPRNIYWNNFLNIHNVFVITDEKLDDTGNHDYPALVTPAAGKTGFRLIPGLGLGTKKVLTDEFGRVIVGVRSEYGIHFMVIQRSVFELDGTINGYNATTNGYSYNNVTIDEYYTTKTPRDQDYPKNGTVAKTTYVNYLNADTSTYIERANTVKNNIKGFDPMYDYRIFEEFVKNEQIKINDETVREEIDRYIEQKRSYNTWSDEQDVQKTWQSYLDLLNAQYEERDDDYGTDLEGSKRLVKITCAINFDDYDPDLALWKKGGACYYEK